MALKVKDIADRLGVSQATVSLVLNNKPGVSEETRKKVLKFIEEMGYDTNILSKPALKHNGNIRFIVYKKHGKVVSDTPFFSALMEGIDSEARDSGYSLVVSYVNEKDNKPEILRILQENPPEGIIILATEMVSEDVADFKRLGIPIVVLDNYFISEKLDTVIINNIEGAYEATKYIIKKGHTDIGYLSSKVHINNFLERREGFLKAIKESGLDFDPKFEYKIGSTLEEAYQDMLVLLDNNPPIPSAFFADNDIIALGAVKALKQKGLKIPEDVSIVGFDDMPFCEMIEPSLTTVRVYKQKMGMIAVRRLRSKIEDEAEENVKIEIMTELIERNSVFDKLDGCNGRRVRI